MSEPQEPLFRALHEEITKLYGDREQIASVLIRTRSGLRLHIDVPGWWRPEAEAKGPMRHGPGFRSVYANGVNYSFTKTQARVVARLWEAWENGTPDVPDELLCKTAGTTGERLADVFRECPAWGTLIVEGGSRGVHRLVASP